GDFGPLFRPDSLVDQGQLHVLQGVQGGDQVVALEDEADLHVADVGELVVVHAAGQLAVEVIAAPGGEIQAAQHVHQGGLARAGGADNGHELPPADGQGDAVEGPHLVLLPLVVDLVDLFQLDQAHGAPPHIMSKELPDSTSFWVKTSMPSSTPLLISTWALLDRPVSTGTA